MTATIRAQTFGFESYPKERMNCYQCDYCGNTLDLDWCPETDVNYCGQCKSSHEADTHVLYRSIKS